MLKRRKRDVRRNTELGVCFEMSLMAKLGLTNVLIFGYNFCAVTSKQDPQQR